MECLYEWMRMNWIVDLLLSSLNAVHDIYSLLKKFSSRKKLTSFREHVEEEMIRNEEWGDHFSLQSCSIKFFEINYTITSSIDHSKHIPTRNSAGSSHARVRISALNLPTPREFPNRKFARPARPPWGPPGTPPPPTPPKTVRGHQTRNDSTGLSCRLPYHGFGVFWPPRKGVYH